MAVRMVCAGITLLYMCSLASSTSWFYSAPRALFGLAGTASASASAPATPKSFIADLRRKEAKTAELQDEKSSVGLEPLPEESDNDNVEGSNEAAPSLLQKKISKVLAKLRLIAQIKNAYHYRPETHEHDTNISLASQENATEPRNSTESAKNEELIERRIVNVKSRSENIQQIPPPSGAYGSSRITIVFPATEQEPTKVDLNVNKISDKLEDLEVPMNGKLKEHEPSRLGALGVFFAELVGSIVGLTYGAVAQIASGGQSPVTISTSEGL